MSILSPNSHLLYKELHHRDHHQPQLQNLSNGCCSNTIKTCGFGFDRRKVDQTKKIVKRDCKAEAFWELSRPAFVEMEPITDADHLDLILEQAKQASQPIIIDWMAAWCRKCIYLKPKLEKLAAEYDTKFYLVKKYGIGGQWVSDMLLLTREFLNRLKFYCVDVNNVPQALVKRGNISKMPTIQLWKDGEMKAEVIGGHKAWLVIEEVKQMIQKFV